MQVNITEKHAYIYSLRKYGVYLLSPKDTIIRHMSFPHLKKKEIDAALKNEYLSYAAISGGTPLINWRIVSEDDNNITVLAIGVKKEFLDEIYEEIKRKEKVRLFAAVVSVGVVAELVRDLSSEKDFGVVFMGPSQTDVIFYKDGNPVYGRNINIGENDIFTNGGLSERDITDFISYIDEAIIRNFSSPVKVFIASISMKDTDIVRAVSRYSSYEILSFNELMSITEEETHEALLKASWNLGTMGHPLFVFVPPAYLEEKKVGRRVFYTALTLIVVSLLGLGSINLSYQQISALRLDLAGKEKKIQLLQDQITKLTPYEEEYQKLIKQRESLGKMSMIENPPYRYFKYYKEIGDIVFKGHGKLLSIGGTSDLLLITMEFSSEKDMLTVLDGFKKSDLFGRLVVYSTSKSVNNDSIIYTVNIGVSPK